MRSWPLPGGGSRQLPRRRGPMQQPVRQQRRPQPAAPPSPPRPSHQRTTCCQWLHLRQRLRTAQPQQSDEPSVQSLLRRHHRLQLQSTLVPTRRQRAVSAAVVAPPPHRCSRDGHCSRPRCSGRRDGDWWRSCHSTSTSPTRREATRTRRSSLPPDVCTVEYAHARATCTRPTALWGRLLRRPLLHRSSPPRRPRSSLPRRSGRCLPAAAPAPSHALAHARPAFDPATAAVRRCRIG